MCLRYFAKFNETLAEYLAHLSRWLNRTCVTEGVSPPTCHALSATFPGKRSAQPRRGLSGHNSAFYLSHGIELPACSPIHQSVAPRNFRIGAGCRPAHLGSA